MIKIKLCICLSVVNLEYLVINRRIFFGLHTWLFLHSVPGIYSFNDRTLPSTHHQHREDARGAHGWGEKISAVCARNVYPQAWLKAHLEGRK